MEQIMPNVVDPFIQELVKKATILGQSSSQISETIDQVKEMKAPRWSVSPQWITFECGCRGERVLRVYGAEVWDPIIFEGTPEQAVYEGVCSLHLPSMNARLKFGGFVDFQQWSDRRRRQLIGKVL